MSELIVKNERNSLLRKHLLTTVSAMSALALLGAAEEGRAEDIDHPTVWLELGGQLQALSNTQTPFAPPFLGGIEQYGIRSPLSVEHPPSYGFAAEGSILFQPQASDWVFSASVRYGRSSKSKSSHQQTPNAHLHVHFTTPSGKYLKSNGDGKYPSSHVKFADATARQTESHTVLDFRVGKDVGLGTFGTNGPSVVSAGLRFAQFSSKSTVTMNMEPDLQYPNQPLYSIPAVIAFRNAAIHFHDDAATEEAKRNFHGIGPSLEWKASAPFIGNAERGEITFDWGANAAILFGRQTAHGHHQTTVRAYYKQGLNGQRKVGLLGSAFATISVTQRSQAHAFDRARSVVVPNLGGFAGLSYRYDEAKISFGYRADFFFGAMDEGIDATQKENRGFYGPFATVSIGLGG